MPSLSLARLAAFLIPTVSGGVIAGCIDGASSLSSGHCASDPELQCGDGFDGFDCTSGRPDEHPQFSKGAIQGTVCTALGPVRDDGTNSFCCTSATTSCGYDPSAGCQAPAYGYSCIGAGRPETFDATLFCGTGMPVNGHTAFCCSAMNKAPCARNANVSCPTTTVGFACTDPTSVPNQSEQGVDQSRSDAVLLCSVPSMLSAGRYGYCCYTPTPTPIGSTCLQDQGVPGCPTGSFGFACTGPDRPEQDYPRMACASAPIAGKNAQGVPATLYCCQYAAN